jgi:uncharacterized membrane protein YdjX (TVP38/TMEM64 family)
MKRKEKLLKILKYLPLVVIIVAAVVLLAMGKKLSVEGVINYSPANPLLAVMFLMVMYAFKSMAVIFPIVILFIADGMLFPTPAALIISVIGCMVSASLPYWAGRLSGSDVIEGLTERHPKIKQLMDIQQDNKVFFTFFIRVLCVFPYDVVSMYMGASEIPYLKYLLGTALGMFPNIVAATLIGNSIADPASPNFITAIGINILLGGITLLVYRIFSRKHVKEAHQGQ